MVPMLVMEAVSDVTDVAIVFFPLSVDSILVADETKNAEE
jgi:hypothetical protein